MIYKSKSLRGGAYDGSSFVDRSLSKFYPYKSNINQSLLYEKEILSARADHLYRNDSYVRGLIEELVTAITSTAITPQPTIKNNVIGMPDSVARNNEEVIKSEFDVYSQAENCDIRGRFNFYELQGMALRMVLKDGDVFVYLPIRKGKIKIQLLNNYRIDTSYAYKYVPTANGRGVFEGVEMDRDGRHVAYWINTTYNINNFYNQYESYNVRRVRAYDYMSGRKKMLMLGIFRDAEQVRGEPLLAPIIKLSKNRHQYQEAELINSLVQSIFSLVIKNNTNNPSILPNPNESGDNDDDVTFDFSTPGSFTELKDGQDISTINPSRPTSNYTSFMENLLKEISRAGNIPYEILTQNFQSSYSASRAAMLKYDNFCDVLRMKVLIKPFCQPIYEQFVDQLVMRGRIQVPSDYWENEVVRNCICGADWLGRPKLQIDEVKQMSALQMKLNNGLITREEACRILNGSSFKDNIKKLKEENMLLQDALGIVSGDREKNR